MNKKYPDNAHFHGRMCRIYIGLTDEQAVYLGAMHQQSSMFQHDTTYIEEVERCRMLLFESENISGDPPEPRPLWRDDCSRILGKEKKGLSEIFAMARVGKDVWKEFQEVNSLYEKGKLKDQKVSAGEVMRGVVSLKQWHMKTLCSLDDEQRVSLLRKVKEKEISLNEMKNEASNARVLSQVQVAIAKFFQLESWEEAIEKFGESVKSERLLRFRGTDFEKLHEFKMFLKHLQLKVDPANEDSSVENIISGPDGETKGHVIFSKYDSVDVSASYFENGAFLTIGHVGYHSEDIDAEVSTLVDMAVQINFKRLMTVFNIIIVCPVTSMNKVQERILFGGAAQIQTGFIAKRKAVLNSRDLLMTEVVDCFIVGHWAVSYKKLTERHVSRHMTNLVDVEMGVDGLHEELYESIIKTFSKEGDLVLDIGSGNGNGMLASLKLKRTSIFIGQRTEESEKWEFVENLRERARSEEGASN